MKFIRNSFITCCFALSATQAVHADYLYSPYHLMTMNMTFSLEQQNLAPLDLVKISQQTGIQSYHLAFVIDASSCKPAWDGQYTTSSGWAKDLTDRMRAAGIKYFVSFGGAAGNDISQKCSQSQLLNAYNQIIATYQPNGLDFDIENGSANVSKIMTALQSVQAANPNLKISFTLPVMPEGLPSAQQNIVKQAKSAGITNFVVNIMAMDYGFSYRGDMGKYAMQAATNTFNFLQKLYPEKSSQEVWQMLEVTPMIGVNDTPGEKFTLNNATTLRNFILEKNAYGIAMWSLDRDKPCGGSRPRGTCSGGNAQSKNYEFSFRFLGTAK